MLPKLKDALDKIVEQIEQGTVPWQASWRTGMPHNVVTGKTYNGINILMLMVESQLKDYPTAQWAGIGQWRTKGASIRKGEKGTVICYYGQGMNEENGEKKGYRFLKHSHVWNVAQVDGYEPEVYENERIEPIDQWLVTKGYDAHIVDGAHYSPSFIPSKDVIRMPHIDQFRSSDSYYATLLHEMVHWTGMPSRLARYDDSMKHLTPSTLEYAAEELVAEMASAFLGTHFTLDDDQHASYLRSWLGKFPKDKRANALMHAASQASHAYEYLLDRSDRQEQAA